MTTDQTFQVLLGRKSDVQTSLEIIAKRAVRKGLTPVSWTWGKAYTERANRDRRDHEQGETCFASRDAISRIPLTIEGDGAHYDGWTFIAALTHLEGENVVRSVLEHDVPGMYRTRGPMCDHCQMVRRRNETYVLRHEDSHTVQVGSTCVADFLGSKEATKLAARASMLAEVRACLDDIDGEGMGGGSLSSDLTLSEYLPTVAWAVRTQGWISRTAAREKGQDDNATADRAWTWIHSQDAAERIGCAPTADDAAVAQAAEVWAETLSDETLAKEKGDYLHNLRAIARSGLVTQKLAGLAASMVTAYQRAMAQEREAAERAVNTLNAYVGTVGKRQTWTLRLVMVTGYETAYGYTTVYKFQTLEGAMMVWKASSHPQVNGQTLGRQQVGLTYRVKGTVKAHEEYKGERQTLLSRCNIEASETVNA